MTENLKKPYTGWLPKSPLPPGMGDDVGCGRDIFTADTTEAEVAFYFGGLASLCIVELERGRVDPMDAEPLLDWVTEVCLKFAPAAMNLERRSGELRDMYKAMGALRNAGARVIVASGQELNDILEQIKK